MKLGPSEASFSAERAETATFTPRAASCSAISRPIPVDAPVIQAVFQTMGSATAQMPTNGCISRAASVLKRVGRSVATRQMQS